MVSILDVPISSRLVSLCFSALSVRALVKYGQQVPLAITMDPLAIGVYCVNETWTQDSASLTQLIVSDISSIYSLHSSGDEAVQAASQRGIEIVLSLKAKSAILDRIPVNSRSYVVRPPGSLGVRKDSCVKRKPLGLSAHTSIDK